MKNPELQKVKEIIAEPGLDQKLDGVFLHRPVGRAIALWNFTRSLQEAEVETIDEVVGMEKDSHDLTHLCGIHKFKYMAGKAAELRIFWSFLWERADVLNSQAGLREYIEFVLENSTVRAGKTRHSLGLFPVLSGHETGKGWKPWRTSEWYENRKPSRQIVTPVTEFYPYITAQPTEEHDLILTVDKLVPKGLPNQTRADVCQDMLVALLTGEVTLDNLKDKTGEYVKRFFKQFAPKYGHLSLDHPVRAGDSRSLRELIFDGNAM